MELQADRTAQRGTFLGLGKKGYVIGHKTVASQQYGNRAAVLHCCNVGFAWNTFKTFYQSTVRDLELVFSLHAVAFHEKQEFNLSYFPLLTN